MMACFPTKSKETASTVEVFVFGGTENGYYCYRVQVSDDQSSNYSSEQQCIWLADHYSNEQVDKAVTLADESAMSYQAQN